MIFYFGNGLGTLFGGLVFLKMTSREFALSIGL